VGRELVDLAVVVEGRIVDRDGHDLVVVSLVIAHLEAADGAGAHDDE
jgi:hypothetical protein